MQNYLEQNKIYGSGAKNDQAAVKKDLSAVKKDRAGMKID